MSPTAAGLAKVQDIYLLQVELWKMLDQDLRRPEALKEARKCVRTFKQLLNEVDWRYMGGEDVLNALQEIGAQASKYITERAARGRKK